MLCVAWVFVFSKTLTIITGLFVISALFPFLTHAFFSLIFFHLHPSRLHFFNLSPFSPSWSPSGTSFYSLLNLYPAFYPPFIRLSLNYPYYSLYFRPYTLQVFINVTVFILLLQVVKPFLFGILTISISLSRLISHCDIFFHSFYLSHAYSKKAFMKNFGKYSLFTEIKIWKMWLQNLISQPWKTLKWLFFPLANSPKIKKKYLK